MPTTKHWYAITETDDITAALTAARRAWPGLSEQPAGLLRKLIREGQAQLERKREEASAALIKGH